jgi:hypothetical protein
MTTLTLQWLERFTAVNDGEEPMTVPQSHTTEPSLGRDVSYVVRHPLRNRWTLVALASLAVTLGLYFGGWAWLVAAGLAPIILSTLPCLIMCGLGVCIMCSGGQKQSAANRDPADVSTSTALGVPETGNSSVSAAHCCRGGTVEDQPAQFEQARSEEGSNTHSTSQ